MTVPLQGILFDLDDTLLDTAAAEQRRWVEVCALARCVAPDVDEAELHTRYRSFDQGRTEVDTGLMAYDDFRQARLREALRPWSPVGTRLFAAYLQLSNAIADGIRPLPGAIALIEQLRGHGLPVAVVTNGPSAWQRRKLGLTGIGELVDAVVISAEVGRTKPDPAPFLRACELLGIDPPGAIMVGDNPVCDIAGAALAGLGGSLFTGPDGHPLADLPQLLALRAAS